MLNHLVGKDTLNGVALELLSNLLNNLGDRVVSRGLSNLALGSLEGVPCGKDDVGLASSDWTVSDNHSGSGIGSVAINMSSADA